MSENVLEIKTWLSTTKPPSFAEAVNDVSFTIKAGNTGLVGETGVVKP